MPTQENPHAGTGSVVLDIGGDIGALVVVMPAEMDGMEVEIVPTGTDARPPEVIDPAAPEGRHDQPHDHDHHTHDHDHSHDHGHTHDTHDHDHHTHEHSHDHEQVAAGASSMPPPPPHVAVVGRPTPGGAVVHSLVYSALVEGSYDLYIRPFGPVHLTATVVGGQVTQTNWN